MTQFSSISTQRNDMFSKLLRPLNKSTKRDYCLKINKVLHSYYLVYFIVNVLMMKSSSVAQNLVFRIHNLKGQTLFLEILGPWCPSSRITNI